MSHRARGCAHRWRSWAHDANLRPLRCEVRDPDRLVANEHFRPALAERHI
jgi:hypothetical protein